MGRRRFGICCVAFSNRNPCSATGPVTIHGCGAIGRLLNSERLAINTGCCLSTGCRLRGTVALLLRGLRTTNGLRGAVVILANSRCPCCLGSAGLTSVTNNAISSSFSGCGSAYVVCYRNVRAIRISTPYYGISVLPAMLGLFNVRCSSHLVTNASVFSRGAGVTVLCGGDFIASGIGCGTRANGTR